MELQSIISIIAIVGSVALAAFFAITGQWAKVREMAYMFMLAANKNMPDALGKEKMAAVICSLYPVLPTIFKKLVGDEDSFRILLQGWYDNAKHYLTDYLDDGILNASNKKTEG